MKKIALVAPGGGMASSWAVGAILALKDYYGLTAETVHTTIASSGSAGTASYMTARQYNYFREIWQQRISGKEFINFLRLGKIMDIDYLIDEVFKKQCPLDVTAIQQSPMELLIPATHAITGEVRYFSNRDKVDHFEVLRAAKAVPIAYGRRVYIGDEPYLDSELGSSLSMNVKKAVSTGADLVIVLDNAREGSHTNIALYGYGWLSPRKLRLVIHGKNRLPVFIHDGPSRIVTVRPSKAVPTGLLDNNENLVRLAINLGFNDVKENVDLQKYV